MARRTIASQLNKPLPIIQASISPSRVVNASPGRPILLVPESPIPTISIDTSMLVDNLGGLDYYGQSFHTNSQATTQKNSQTVIRMGPHSQAATSATHGRGRSSSLQSSPCSPNHTIVPVSSRSTSHISTNAAHIHMPHSSPQEKLDPRASSRLTTAHALSLLDFLEAQETEMRGEVQRVLRRMREVKRVVRAVKRERGRMMEKDRFADSEAEVTVGSAQ